ncbi:cobyrinic acid a,c-diamide synthase [Ruminococcus flavefaciens]|uniref:Cobyrinic acid a,c-diamide synthase n=1 Tax=Ruminococcus flavefaciens TaxID=1265 RepID=A0A1H6K0J4_RUMFL|nr:cobyrinate a,c-diamide synthase [Ruminococcus flavefaciens]SEH66433.1 cobyrinic acid a,c-diamide synthase [Ruminococcus flavefaciens]
MKRIMIAGTHSGCGKTTMTCAILAALKSRNMRVSAFKCGPDYIDPMFHQKVIGVPSHNLDSFFCSDETLKYLMHENSRNSDISVIEGVMGFYDGVDGRGSAHSVSMITETPAVVVIDCKGASESIGAVMKGFLSYKQPNMIKGFIFNRLPERLVPHIKELCSELGTAFLGYMPTNSFTFESRRLGLVTVDEIDDIKEKLAELRSLAEKNILLDELIGVSEAPFPKFTEPKLNTVEYKNRPIIAVAKDEAFCFTYSDNIALLEKLGCRIEYFSPLRDKKLPESCCGLILSGGYPELYAEKLSQNHEMLQAVRCAVNSGIPTIAECGGFMYLHEKIIMSDDETFGLVGAVKGDVYSTKKLQRFGYVTLEAKKDCLICNKSDKIAAHEFHYWDSTNCGSDFIARKSDGRNWACVHSHRSMYAGFPHLYFYADLRIAERFVAACAEYGEKHGQNK